mmetsp:Transcript_9219/g.26951  ORF Transcript_9219/g.26951 Transcript_9219/m.26951 type:complete len:238 (-) Transcript_9219:17-730(-)
MPRGHPILALLPGPLRPLPPRPSPPRRPARRLCASQVRECRRKELQQRLLEELEDVLDLLVELVALELVPVPLEDRVPDLQQRRPLLEVLWRHAERRAGLLHECGEQRLPALGEVVRGDDRDGLGELRLDRLGYHEEEREQVVAHLLLDVFADCHLRGLRIPVPLAHVLEEDRGGLLDVRRLAVGGEQGEHAGGSGGRLLELLQPRLGLFARIRVRIDRLREAAGQLSWVGHSVALE